MEGKKQIIKSTKAQRRKLTEFMSINRAFANGEFSGPLGSRRMEEQWAALKDLLSELGPDKSVGQWKQMKFLLGLALVTTSEAFFLKWGSDTSRQSAGQKTWVQPLSSNIPPAYRYQYMYSPYDQRKLYQVQQSYQQEMPIPQSMAPIPISVPAGASLTPVSLQHVQLVPCMCPVAPEEADKLQEQVGPGPYLAQTYQQPYSVPQQMTVATDNKQNTKQ